MLWWDLYSHEVLITQRLIVYVKMSVQLRHHDVMRNRDIELRLKGGIAISEALAHRFCRMILSKAIQAGFARCHNLVNHNPRP